MINLTANTVTVRLPDGGAITFPPSGRVLTLEEISGEPTTVETPLGVVPVVPLRGYGRLVGEIPDPDATVLVVAFPPLITALRAAGHRGRIFAPGLAKRGADGSMFVEALREHDPEGTLSAQEAELRRLMANAIC
ncbi:MAG TPA: hypothetical protein VEI97_14495 [bacterium]|nr:hypothetical protein [bacterium]